MLTLAPLLLAALSVPQDRPATPPAPPVPDSTFRSTAVRAAHAPQIDGRDDDEVWRLAPPITAFREFQPVQGKAPSYATLAEVAYDDRNLYVFVRAFDPSPATIRQLLARRDGWPPGDHIVVVVDSYHDRRTGYEFGACPSGARYDAVLTNDGDEDGAWDGVWDLATRVDSLGWTAEFRIPLSQLRYADAPEHTFGLAIARDIGRTNERVSWPEFRRDRPGITSQLGDLGGIAGISSPRRLEVLPYVVTKNVTTTRDTGFGRAQRLTGGADIKFGVTSNLTLDATVNPDFGQVEADPAEVNLTAYESYFSERRPFFVEGADIFSTTSPGFIPVSGAQFLYSRRIGRAPQGYADARTGFVDQPSSSTILGATKLTGRTAGGWSVGLLDAVTAREFATVDSAGVRFRDEVEPLTNYTVLRAKRDFGGGSSSLGLMGTAVNRRMDDTRLDFLRSAAYTGGLDFSHRFSRNRYSLFAALGYSYIQGDTLAIQAAQRSSARYYQRPDANYIDYLPTRTSLAGWNAAFGVSKDQGATNVALGVSATSPGFEINDLGYQTRADRATANVWVGHRWTRPGRVFRSAQATAGGNLGWNFGGDRVATSANTSVYGQFLNFWSINAGLSGGLRVVNDGLLRGGPAGIQPANWSVYGSISSDYRKPVQAFVNYQYTRNELHGWGSYWYASLSVRPTSTISISAGPSYSASLTPQQYVAGFADATAAATFGRRYVFAEILQHSLDLTTRLNVTVTPTLSLQLYAQPFVATGAYSRFKELVAPRTTDYAAIADSAAPAGLDFNYRSLRGNAVLRWEYRPGSTLFLVWSTSCSAYGSDPAFNAAQNMRQLCPGRSDNVFAVKMNYWLSL